MTLDEFALLRVGEKVVVVGDGCMHGYRIGKTYWVILKESARAYLTSDDPTVYRLGSSSPRTAPYVEPRDIDRVSTSRNSEVKKLTAEIAELERIIESRKARIAWLKTYKDSVDEVLSKVFTEGGIEDKNLRKLVYSGLKDAGFPMNFTLPQPKPTEAPVVSGAYGYGTITAGNSVPAPTPELDPSDFEEYF